jgi:hypothetical protein
MNSMNTYLTPIAVSSTGTTEVSLEDKDAVTTAINHYHQLVKAGAYPGKTEAMLSSTLPESEREAFTEGIRKPTAPVSGTRHSDGSRNWKAINANRRTSQIASDFQISRYQMDQTALLQKYAGPDYKEVYEPQIEAGSLKIQDAIRQAKQKLVDKLTPKQKAELADRDATRKVTKYWKCMRKAIREMGIEEEDDITQTLLNILGSWSGYKVWLEPDTE